MEAQAEYAAWLESLPESLQDSATAEALRTICDLDLTELQAIEPPRGLDKHGLDSNETGDVVGPATGPPAMISRTAPCG